MKLKQQFQTQCFTLICGVRVEVREKLVGVHSLYHMGSGDEAQIVNGGSKTSSAEPSLPALNSLNTEKNLRIWLS